MNARPQPFRRVIVLVSAFTAAVANFKAAVSGIDVETQRQKVRQAQADLFDYRSRGKGRGFVSFPPINGARNRRQAEKRRNVMRNKLAHRGHACS